MSVLIPMTEADCQVFLAETIAQYAQSNVESGRWAAETALARSKTELGRLLPQGLATPDNQLLTIVDETGEAVGVLWWAAVEQAGVRNPFIYEIRIHPRHRRQGHAKRALQALESIVRELGYTRLGLHVFAYNEGAQALYRALGFEVMSLNMAKRLAVD
ncbi:MAG: GNAT family N-acetyltransferase [Burkholderiales bacterium]|nr:GNAT family N-acetyltransferase [Burkholderiales bacterium]